MLFELKHIPTHLQRQKKRAPPPKKKTHTPLPRGSFHRPLGPPRPAEGVGFGRWRSELQCRPERLWLKNTGYPKTQKKPVDKGKRGPKPKPMGFWWAIFLSHMVKRKKPLQLLLCRKQGLPDIQVPSLKENKSFVTSAGQICTEKASESSKVDVQVQRYKKVNRT